MARTAAKAPAKAKTPAVKKTSTPKRTPSRKAKLMMRDLHSMADGVEQKMANVLRVCNELSGLRGKVDLVSTNVEDAQKEHDERVGKVERDILQHQLAEVAKVLKDTKKVAVDTFEMDALKKLQREKDADSQKSTKELEAEVAAKVAELVRFKEVEFQKEYAQSVADQALIDAERRTLHATIASMRFEIESQKNLSSDIAQANRQKKINELRRKAIEDMNAKEQAKDEAMFRSQMGLAGMQAPAPVPAPAPVAAATPPIPRPAKKPAGKKATPSKKPVQPPPPSPSSSESEVSSETREDTETDSDEPPKKSQETPKLKRRASELARQGSATKKPAAKKAKK